MGECVPDGGNAETIGTGRIRIVLFNRLARAEAVAAEAVRI